MSIKGVGDSGISSYKDTSVPDKHPVEEVSGKGYAVKSSAGDSQLADKGGNTGSQSLDLSSRQVKQLLNSLFKSRGKVPDGHFYNSIQTILPGVDKKVINLFLVSHQLAFKGNEDDEIILKSLSNRQVKTNIKLTKMEMGEYDLKAASSAMAKYVSQIEEKELGHRLHKKAVAKKVAKAMAKLHKDRTGRAAPDTFQASLKKRASNATTAIASKDCLLTLDSLKISGKSSTKSKRRKSGTRDDHQDPDKGDG